MTSCARRSLSYFCVPFRDQGALELLDAMVREGPQAAEHEHEHGEARAEKVRILAFDHVVVVAHARIALEALRLYADELPERVLEGVGPCRAVGFADLQNLLLRREAGIVARLCT